MPLTAHAARTPRRSRPSRQDEHGFGAPPRPASASHPGDPGPEHVPRAIGPAGAPTPSPVVPYPSRPAAQGRIRPVRAPAQHSYHSGCSNCCCASRRRGCTTARQVPSDASGPLCATPRGLKRRKIGGRCGVWAVRPGRPTTRRHPPLNADIIGPAHAICTCITTVRISGHARIDRSCWPNHTITFTGPTNQANARVGIAQGPGMGGALDVAAARSGAASGVQRPYHRSWMRVGPAQ
jgi:hypothetical protein